MDCADSFACLIYLMIVSMHRDVSVNVIDKIILDDVPNQWTQRVASRTATNNTFPTTTLEKKLKIQPSFYLVLTWKFAGFHGKSHFSGKQRPQVTTLIF